MEQEKEKSPHTIDALKHEQKKLVDKGILRRDRHPSGGISGVAQPPPKSGHGGKFTWEGPADVAESLLSPPPPALDERDPNFVAGDCIDDDVAAEIVVGEVEVSKVAREGVARVELDPRLENSLV